VRGEVEAARVGGSALNATLGGEGKGRGRGGHRDRGGAGQFGQGRWAPEVGDDPDRWAPPVGEREREERGGGPAGAVGLRK
jgi:hypothetical protein